MIQILLSEYTFDQQWGYPDLSQVIHKDMKS